MGYSNSSLVAYTLLSPNHSGLRTEQIDRISPHCVVGQCTAEGLGDWFHKSSTKASSNYGIDRNGRVGLYVEEKNRSWCTSSNANDQRAVTIECASDKEEPYAMHQVVYDRLVDLCEDICRRNGKITGYLTFDFVQVDHYTDMYHDLAVRELVCEDMETMKQFLTFFASQTDQIERVRIYTYEEYFHILFTNPDSGENRAYDGAIQETGRKIMGFMFRILDLEEYFRQQSHCDKPVSRAFTLELQVEDDFMESNNKTIWLRIEGDRVCQTDAQKADVVLKAKIADLSSLVVGAIPLEAFLWSEQMECSDHAYVQDIQNAIGWSRKPKNYTYF